MVSSNYKVSPLGKHKIETPPEYCELFHKGNRESGNAGNPWQSGNAGNWQSGILGNLRESGIAGNV